MSTAFATFIIARADAGEGPLGRVGARGMSTFVSLQLAAIGVQFVRQGLAPEP
jgi:small neutral amino acid transporter SnatA (MarC family)